MVFSCEVFPPKRNDDIYEIFKTLDEIKLLKPDFISVTYGAGGSNSKKTATIAAYIQNICEVEALAHMTAVGMDELRLKEIMQELKNKGVNNVLALRGDKPRDMTDDEFQNRYFKYASDFIPKLKEYNVCVAAACYPEVHPESKNVIEDIEFLKKKVDSGVDFIISQLFFDNEKFLRFIDLARKEGITAPLSAGIMPVTTVNQLGTTVKLSGSSVPCELSNIIARFGQSPEDMRKAGIEYAIKQINELKKEGVQGIHLYSMNKADITKEIYEATMLQ